MRRCLMAKIVFISELDLSGSGYSHITINLCKGLVEQGHEVKVCALSYKNEEHNWNVSQSISCLETGCVDCGFGHSLARNDAPSLATIQYSIYRNHAS